VLGAVLADRRNVQLSAAVLTLVLAGLFDLLFFVVDELPATVPVALALIIVEVWSRSRRRAESRADAVTPASAAYRRPWTRAGAIPRRAR